MSNTEERIIQNLPPSCNNKPSMSLTANIVSSSYNNPDQSSSPLPEAISKVLASSPSLPPSVPSLDKTLNKITVFLICLFLLFSLFSLSLIFYLRLLSRRHLRLRSFAFHSPPRFLLTTFASLWLVSELLRIPPVRFNHIPSISMHHQAQFCSLHIIISLGFFQPGFLVSLIFLVSSSIQTTHVFNSDQRCSCPVGGFLKVLGFIFVCCSPISLTLYLTIYHLSTRIPLPSVFYQTAAFFNDSGRWFVLCTYPLLSAVIFGGFSVLYSMVLLFKCWKVISMAINKRIASRINVLSFTILICLAVQVVLMSLSVFLNPMEAMYYLLVFVIFFNALVCVIVGESILVVIPIIDALSTVLISSSDAKESVGVDV